ncbi:hypothetical protein CERSUDRAFT_72858 [Gelatoporia subvermispora B]|uniref:Uncharacterized protein n=1 Tax=Ceriporiopsis subvermispora (strain B) TaxID=914234 RepID=M2QMP7_CERS8|nr:hypothetical protein CERSUDRAFT_72858 [Gelatoporia subvermispora B]
MNRNWPLLILDEDAAYTYAPYPSTPSHPLIIQTNPQRISPYHPWHLLERPHAFPIHESQPFASTIGTGLFHDIQGFKAGTVIIAATLDDEPQKTIFIAVPRAWICMQEPDDELYSKCQLMLNPDVFPLTENDNNDLRPSHATLAKRQMRSQRGTRSTRNTVTGGTHTLNEPDQQTPEQTGRRNHEPDTSAV